MPRFCASPGVLLREVGFEQRFGQRFEQRFGQRFEHAARAGFHGVCRLTVRADPLAPSVNRDPD
jgi:hydroxypyruvate isomerase